MTERAPPPLSERAAGLAVAAVLHLSLFALLMSVRGGAPPPPVRAGSLTIMSLNASEPDGKPPPPALPSEAADQQRMVREVAFSKEPDSTAQGAAGGCAVLEGVMQSLVDDPAAVAAVIATPPESRSIADAVVIWNAGWSDVAGNLGAPLAPARVVLEQSLAANADECLDAPVAGPRLVPIPDGNRTMFLAIGSGSWTWRQLLADPPLIAVDGQTANPSTPAWDWFSMFDTR